MVQNRSWEVNWFAASQEIPRISRNPKVQYRTHKRPAPVSILGQPNPVHIPTSHLLEIRPNIIHPSTPRSPQWSLSLRFHHQDPIHPPLNNSVIKYVVETQKEKRKKERRKERKKLNKRKIKRKGRKEGVTTCWNRLSVTEKDKFISATLTL